MNHSYQLAAKAKLPVSFANGVIVDILSFVSGAKEDETTALVYKKEKALDSNKVSDESAPLVRLHSACITGEAFGSLKCDCGYQLQYAMEKICNSDFGVLVYFNRHEGRGIGLTNKIRAYAMQDNGLNTIDANVKLGFNIDSRDFSAALAIFKYLDIDKVRLMTNNPKKVAILEQNNIKVIERVPIQSPVNIYNQDYLRTKKDLMEHMLEFC